MQRWDERQLEDLRDRRSAVTAPPTLARVAVMGPDPLARRGLALSLAPDVEIVADEAVPGVDVIVLDDGPDGHADTQGTLAEGTPIVCLVRDAARARVLLGRGARGVFRRDVEPTVLASAIQAVRYGIIVLDPRLALELLPTRAELAIPFVLTPREKEVLELLAEGLSNKDIALALGVSPHTAKFHVTALLDKLGPETRTEAVVLAARQGLVAL